MQQAHLLLLLAAAAAAALAATPAAGSADAAAAAPPLQQCDPGPWLEADGPQVLSPKFCITDDGDHLSNVRDVLRLLGFTETQNPADANVIWAWRDPFTKPDASAEPKRAAAHAHLRNLQQHQFLNQMPGSGFMVAKSELAKLSQELDVLPKTFSLPEEYDRWQAFIKTERGADMEWIQKSRTHRGISIIPDTSASSLKDIKDNILVQQLIRPYLINNRLWDVGIYVAITSLEPLMAYVYTGGVLLRFCSQDYQHKITPDTPRSTYVIYGLDDYTPASKVPDMKAHFADAGNDTRWGTTMSLVALRSYLESHGVDTQTWWLEVQSVILQVLQHTASNMAATQAHHYTGQRTNFFTLLRFDMMLDENLDTYLVEVNMSPGLYRVDAPLEEQLLSRQLVHDLLLLKGLGPGGHHHPFTPKGLMDLAHHPDGVALGHPACANGCSSAEECNSQPVCMLCRACRSEWQNSVLRRVMSEQLASQGWLRVHPPHRDLTSHLELTGVKAHDAVMSRPDDALVRMWLEAKSRSDFRFS